MAHPLMKIILAAVLCWASVNPAFAVPSSTQSSPLSVVLIVADDLGYGDLGCYGAEKIATPNLDRLASEGLRATNAHATGSVCTPSRYSMMTGRYYIRFRSNWVGELLVEKDRPTLASVLKQNGYATGYFGKWHLGWGEADKREQRAAIDWNKELPQGVLECGFDHFFGTPFTHNEAPFVFVEDRHVVGLEPEDPLIIPPKSEDNGPWGWGNSKGAKKAHAMRPQDRVDLIVTGEALKWLKENCRKPFFLQLALVAPHVPIAPGAEFKGKSGFDAYGDFVQQMDWCVGQILETLKSCGVAENTLVIFTSDNGAVVHKDTLGKGHLSNGLLLGQKTDAWEGGQRVPFLVRWPGKVPAGTVTDALIANTDIVRTIWDATGVKAPEDAAEDSLSQKPLLLDPKAAPLRSEVLVLGIDGMALISGDWFFSPRKGSSGKTTAINDGWLKIHEQGRTNSDYDAQSNLKPDAPEQQLYNLRKDISQTTIVILQHPEKAAELAARYEEIMKDVKKIKAKHTKTAP